MKKQAMKKQALVLALAACGLTAAFSVSAQERVRIGFMSPVTGPQAANGIDNRDGALLALKEINAKGIKVGGKAVQFELDINDDGADPKQGVQVAQRLSDQKVKFVLGPYNSGVTMPASRVLADAGMGVFTVASNPKVTEQVKALEMENQALKDDLGFFERLLPASGGEVRVALGQAFDGGIVQALGQALARVGAQGGEGVGQGHGVAPEKRGKPLLSGLTRRLTVVI